MVYGIRALLPFYDIKRGVTTKIGEIVEVEEKNRLDDILERKLGEFVFAKHKNKKGKNVLIHHTEFYKIGGIETASQQISKAFPDYDITFVVGRNADRTQVLELSKRHSVIIDNGVDNYKADVLLLMNYDSAQSVINRVQADKVYQFVHADWVSLLRLGTFRGGFRLPIHERVNKVLAVSETARAGLKRAFGIESEVVPNILTPIKQERPIFLYLGRATNEKGIDVMLDMFDRFRAAGKEFVVFMATALEQAVQPTRDRIKAADYILQIPPSIYAQELMRSADFLVQLSDQESYCYSVREALQVKTPCIVSDIPELRKLIRDGENGYVIKKDLSNLDVEKIFTKKLKLTAYTEEIDPIWEKVLEGEL